MTLIYPARKAAVHQGWLLQKHLCCLLQQFNSLRSRKHSQKVLCVPVITLPKEQKFEQLQASHSEFQ